MVAAWLPAAVAWQPYGPFAEPRAVQICKWNGLAPGFCAFDECAQSSSDAFPVGLSQWEPVESVMRTRASVSTY